MVKTLFKKEESKFVNKCNVPNDYKLKNVRLLILFLMMKMHTEN